MKYGKKVTQGVRAQSHPRMSIHVQVFVKKSNTSEKDTQKSHTSEKVT